MQSPGTLRPAWAEIDLDALGRNAERLRHAASGRVVRAVLKADAYGHGAVQVARALEKGGIRQFAVALVEEGAELRRAGIGGDILVMGTCREGQCPVVTRHGLVPTISSPSQLAMWLQAAASSDEPLPVHLKVNTGMNRLGMSLDELAVALSTVRSSEHLELAGLMSHLADADLEASPRTDLQVEAFAGAVDLLTDAERRRVEIHIANSAGMLHHDIQGVTAARPGLALFGYDPAGQRTDLEPVMSVRARIVQIHQLDPGERVGYGGRWTAGRASRVATVPLGYADGYPQALGDRGEALVAGRRVPVIGAVSMDMLALDLTGADVHEGETATLLGGDGSESITASELADLAETLVYDVLCGFGLRLPKISLANGETVAVFCRFENRTPA